MRGRRDMLQLRKAQRFEDADIQPADVELVPLDRQLGRSLIGVMVVVQFLAADQDAQWRDVRARIRRGPEPIAPVMANAVDDAGSPEGDPHDLRRQDQRARHDAEEDDVDGPYQGQAEYLKPRVEMALKPIVRSPVAV